MLQLHSLSVLQLIPVLEQILDQYSRVVYLKTEIERQSEREGVRERESEREGEKERGRERERERKREGEKERGRERERERRREREGWQETTMKYNEQVINCTLLLTML